MSKITMQHNHIISQAYIEKFLMISFSIFGFSALIFQVVFAKNLVLLFGLTAPAIATVLAVYFSGLALGSFIFGKLVDKFQDRADKFYISFFLLIGIYGFLTPLLFGLLNILIKGVNNIYPLSFSGFNLFAFIPTVSVGINYKPFNSFLTAAT